MKHATKLKLATEAKRQELIELFESMGHKELVDGREISSLNLPELQEIFKFGIEKNE